MILLWVQARVDRRSRCRRALDRWSRKLVLVAMTADCPLWTVRLVRRERRRTVFPRRVARASVRAGVGGWCGRGGRGGPGPWWFWGGWLLGGPCRSGGSRVGRR